MKVPFVDIPKQYQEIKQELDPLIQDIFNNAQFILGKHVEEFEKNFAEYCGALDCIAVSSGTEALQLALLAHGVGKGEEVICPTYTFFATAEAISHVGATPVLVDCGKDFNIDVSKIEEKITEKTKAIIPVHLYGQVSDMDAINQIAEKHKLAVIQDSCQAHGAEYKGTKIGKLSFTACFSFYPAKNLGAFGEGGAVISNDVKISQKVKALRSHGEFPKNTHSYIGFNYRMSGIQGAVLKTELKKLEEWNELRRKHAKKYRELLSDTSLELPIENENSKHVYHLFVVRSKRRDELIDFLRKNDIGVGIHYPRPVHLQKAYEFLNYKEGSFPIAEQITKEILSLPMFPHLTEEQIVFVCEKIKEFEKGEN